MPYPFTPDPRPLDPPSYWEPESTPERVIAWRFMGADGSDDCALTDDDYDTIENLYINSGIPYQVVTEYIDPF